MNKTKQKEQTHNKTKKRTKTNKGVHFALTKKKNNTKQQKNGEGGKERIDSFFA